MARVDRLMSKLMDDGERRIPHWLNPLIDESPVVDTCPYCYNNIDRNDMFCGKCGQRILKLSGRPSFWDEYKENFETSNKKKSMPDYGLIDDSYMERHEYPTMRVVIDHKSKS